MAAYAYFTATGTANGSAGVGTSTNWSVTGSSGSGLPASTGTLLPGAGSAALAYRVTNPSTGHQGVNSVTVALATSGLNVVDSSTGTGVSGCLASWFSVGSSTFTASDGTTAVSLASPHDLAGGDYITGSTSVTMTNVGSSQDACKLASPRLSVTVG
ncbi:MAG: hypothetical protein JWP02_1053 [Acidimicrobiales bacterium]|nr:hypothetical protein [Acidimicrobiales bacterium]